MSEMCFDDFDYDRHSDNCDCDECRGACPLCNGSRKFISNGAQINGLTLTPIEIPCPKCKGTGEI